MAKNLRSKIKESDTMIIHDVNESALKKFKDEMGNVEIAKDVREVAEKSVCINMRCYKAHFQDECFCSIYDLSWQRKLLL
jgi:hypothetical protein